MTMNSKLITILVFTSLFLVGCSPGKKDVEKYGYEKFSRQVLSYQETKSLNPEIISVFNPKEARIYLNGVLLVYSKSGRYIKGIYVDQESIDGWGGSGLSITPWFENIGWVEIKKRQKANRL
ncbi:MAG: hypothetical protein PVJ69_06785 [Desulfobacteraceae bacterium]|jgi:hypothetical protein